VTERSNADSLRSVLVIIGTVSVPLWFLNIGDIQARVVDPFPRILILVSYVARLFVLHKAIIS